MIDLSEKQINEIKEELDPFIETWLDDVSWLSGWRHQYFCDDDGSFLEYDVQKPFEQACGICGRIYTDEKKNGAWVTITRNKTIKNLRLSTICFLSTKEEKYLIFVKKVILFFANNYKDFPVHIKNRLLKDMSEYDRVQKDMLDEVVSFNPKTTDWKFTGYDIQFQGPGKIMAQGLSEAIALIKIVFVYHFLKQYFTENEKKIINNELFIPAIEFLEKQQFIEHNISLWRAASIIIMKLELGNFELSDLFTKYGVIEHLKNGLTEDGFWYEESIHYHNYVLEALGYVSFFLKEFGYKSKELEFECEKMSKFSYQFAFDNGVFPNPNDGWPNINLKTYIQVNELLVVSYKDNPVIIDIYRNIRKLKVLRIPLPIEDEAYYDDLSTTGIIILDEIPISTLSVTKKTEHFIDSKISVLKNNKFNIMQKYGVNSLSHAHFDPFTIEITADNQVISKDLSNVGYGSDLVHTWYNTPISHNSVIINEENNKIMYDTHITDMNDNELVINSNNIYKNTSIYRKIILEDNTAIITTNVNSLNDNVVDLVQHFDTSNIILLGKGNSTKIRQGEIYPNNLTQDSTYNIEKIKKQKLFPIYLSEFQLFVQFDFDRPVDIYHVETIGNPSNEIRQTLVFRSSNGELNCEMTILGGSVDDKL